MNKPVDRLNKIYDQFKNHFDGAFHTLLWEMMIKNKTKGKVMAFTNLVNGELALAHGEGGGYLSTGVSFKTNNHNEASEICEKLNMATFSKENLDIFGYDFKEPIDACIIVLESMKKEHDEKK